METTPLLARRQSSGTMPGGQPAGEATLIRLAHSPASRLAACPALPARLNVGTGRLAAGTPGRAHVWYVTMAMPRWFRSTGGAGGDRTHDRRIMSPLL